MLFRENRLREDRFVLTTYSAVEPSNRARNRVQICDPGDHSERPCGVLNDRRGGGGSIVFRRERLGATGK